MLPPIASWDDLEAWSSQPISNVERAEAILAAASTLVRSFTGRMWVDADGEWEEAVTDLQKDQVQTVVVAVAERVYTNPQGATQETVGPFSRSVAAWASLGLSLSDEEKAMLAPSNTSGIPGLSSIRVVAPAAARGTSYCVDWWESELYEGDEGS